MSLHDFIKHKTPSVLQSLFRREIGLVGICGHYGKETTSTINVIIHRQLIQSRASRNPLPPPATNNVKIRKAQRSSTFESDSEDDDDSDRGYYGRVKQADIATRLRKKLLTEEWRRSENSDIEILNDIIFIQRSKNCMSYIIHEIKQGLRQHPDLRSQRGISGIKMWSSWDIWWPSTVEENPTNRQHKILFFIENPGHFLKSFHFDSSGKKYIKIHLDPQVRFKSVELSGETLILNSVKASIRGGFDHAVADFIIFNCPDLRLVTRCRITKAAVGNSTVIIQGDYIYLINGHRIEVFNLNETIKSSHQLEPTGYKPAKRLAEGIPCTHLVQEKPVCLYTVGNTSDSYLELGRQLWPPYYVKKNKFEKFQVLPLSESCELSSRMVGVDLLNLVDNNVSHFEDTLSFHPDQSGRLILTGFIEIRVILINRQYQQDEFENGTTHFTVQFSKQLGDPTLNVPGASRRTGLRAVRRPNYVSISDEERGIIRWEYFSKLDLFAILEFSSTIFQVTILDNQVWEQIALINLSDSLPPPRNYYNSKTDFGPFSMDIADGFIAISQNSETTRREKILFIINLLSDDTLVF